MVGIVYPALKCFTLINELQLSASQVANRSEPYTYMLDTVILQTALTATGIGRPMAYELAM